jgi:N-methylhydantoinase A
MAGGDQATVTDANLILGRLSPAGLLGGKMPLDVAAAHAVFMPVAERLGCTIERAAHDVLGLVVSNMALAMRAVAVERGHDPRRLALLAFGGAGPLHASDVARSLGIREVIVPLAPGILCAQGLVVSDLKEDFVRTARTRVDAAHLSQIWEHIQAVTRTGEAWFTAEKLPPDRCVMQMTLDMRYVSQNIELAIPLDPAGLASLNAPEAIAHLHTVFFEAHEMSYGYNNPDDPVEIINYRLSARGRLYHAPEATAAARAAHAPEPVYIRPVYFDAEVVQDTPVFDRARLVTGHTLIGPAVIDQFDATTLIYPGDVMRVDEALNLIIAVSA